MGDAYIHKFFIFMPTVVIFMGEISCKYHNLCKHLLFYSQQRKDIYKRSIYYHVFDFA